MGERADFSKDPIIHEIKKSDHVEVAATRPCSSDSSSKTTYNGPAVCISFSVPASIWIELSQELEKVDGYFVLRGLPEIALKSFQRRSYPSKLGG